MNNEYFPTRQRIPALNMYRVILLLCGFVLHTIVFLHPNVFFQSIAIFRTALIAGQGSFVFNKLALFIALYYMPAFFILAGFFAELLIKKYHYIGFLKNRGRRLFVPIIVIFLTFYSISFLYNYLWYSHYSVATGVPIDWEKICPRTISFGYLWFLEYLVCMEILWFLLRFAGRCIARLLQWDSTSLSPRKFALITLALFLLSIVPLFIYKPNWFFLAATDSSIYSLVWYGLHYFNYFLFGACLVHFPYFKKYSTLKIALGLMLTGCCAFLICLLGFMGKLSFVSMRSGIVLSEIFNWTFSAGLLMCCFKLCKATSKKIQYLVEASYFLYLVQIPTIVIVVRCLSGWHLPFSFGTVLIVMMLSFSIDLVLYQLFVRKRKWLSYIDGAKRQQTRSDSNNKHPVTLDALCRS